MLNKAEKVQVSDPPAGGLKKDLHLITKK